MAIGIIGMQNRSLIFLLFFAKLIQRNVVFGVVKMLKLLTVCSVNPRGLKRGNPYKTNHQQQRTYPNEMNSFNDFSALLRKSVYEY